MTWTRPTIDPKQREQEKALRREALVGNAAPRLHVGRYGGEVQPVAAKPKLTRAQKVRATTAESEHMGRVKRLRCVLCAILELTQDSPTDVHHIREGQGGAQRASHWLTVALCHDGCHQGQHGIHGDRARLRQAKCTELDLLALTLEALEVTHGVV